MSAVRSTTRLWMPTVASAVVDEGVPVFREQLDAAIERVRVHGVEAGTARVLVSQVAALVAVAKEGDLMPSTIAGAWRRVRAALELTEGQSVRGPQAELVAEAMRLVAQHRVDERRLYPLIETRFAELVLLLAAGSATPAESSVDGVR